MKLNTYKLISDAVENGVKYGIRRAHKHCDDPPHELIEQEVRNAVMSEICEYFSFDDDVTVLIP